MKLKQIRALLLAAGLALGVSACSDTLIGPEEVPKGTESHPGVLPIPTASFGTGVTASGG